MDFKRLMNALLCSMALVVLFISCDDEKDKLFAPSQTVTNLSFTDTDFEEGTIGGKLTWDLPADETDIAEYVVYLSSSATVKETELTSVEKGVDEVIIENGTVYSSYIVVVAKNSSGESESLAALAIRDNTSPVATELSFFDEDLDYRFIGGEFSWTAPEINGLSITGYVIYLSDENDKKGEKIGSVEGSATDFKVEEGTAYNKYLQVSVIVNGAESDDFASVFVVDQTTVRGYYILNRGNYQANNATLGYYDFVNGNYTTDLFKEVNGQGLGSSPESMIIYGSKVYIAVYESDLIMVTDLNGKLIKEIRMESGDTMNPRCLTSHEGNVYVSLYKGHCVGRLDTTSLEINKTVKVGRFPEGVVVSNNKLFVANSGGLDYPNYGNTISVIDLSTFEIIKDIVVETNPGKLAVNSLGEVFAISLGDHGLTIDQVLQKINPETYSIEKVGYASIMSLINDKVYVLFNQYYGDMPKGFFVYDALSGDLIADKLVTDGTTMGNPYSLDVDPVTGRIYISDYNYSETTTMYVFNSEGKLESSFDTGGYDTQGVCFYTIKR